MTPPKTVLVLDPAPADFAGIRDALIDARPEPYLVLHAADLAAGLERLGTGPVDLVLLDLACAPDPDLQALVAIRERRPEVPVVIVTAREDPELAARAVREGAQDYLVKRQIHAGVIVRVVRYALERQRILERLRQADRHRSEFVSTLSHEMRTPLSIVREFVSLVHDGVVGPASAEQRDCLVSVLGQCDRLTTLINDLLDLSRIESGQLRLRRLRVDLAPLVHRSVEDFRPNARRKGQQLTLEVPDDLPPVLCDRDKLQQVLINLLGNAHKYTPQGGSITVRAAAAGDRVSVEVLDDGPGIAPGDQARVFDSFIQLERKHGPGSQGTGLGLTIARNIIRLHGGEMRLASAPGKGSRFSFDLPVYAAGAELAALIRDRSKLVDGARATSVVFVRSRLADGAELERLEDFQRCADRVLRSRWDETLLVASQRLLVCVLETPREGCRTALERIALSLRGTGVDLTSLECAVETVSCAEDGVAWPAPSTATFVALASLLAPRPGRKVLIVDDDRAMLRMFQTVLAASPIGLELKLTDSGYEACIQFGRFRPDLVILDLQIPDVDGEQVLRSMRAVRPHGTRFLVVSAHAERFERMRELGCDACLSKPFDSTSLLQHVETLLRTEPLPATVEA